MTSPKSIVLFLVFFVVAGCSRIQDNEIAETLFVDRVNVDWGTGSENHMFEILVRNGSSQAISGNIEFEVDLDLTKVPVYDLEKSLGNINRNELIVKIEESIQMDNASPYLESIHRYLKGDWEKKGSEGFLTVELENDEIGHYKIKTNESVSLAAGETAMVSKSLVIPSHYTNREVSVTVTAFSRK